MPINVSNATIESGDSFFRVKDASSNVLFEQGISAYSGNNFAYYLNQNVPGFIAGSATDPGWILFSSGWTKINQYISATSYNKTNSYNTSTTRFTAPFSGPYLFIFSTYLYTNSYFHPQFTVNGSVSTRRNSVPYRIRGYGWVANYQQDAQMEEVINLVAGDYVEVYCAPGGNTYHYAYYGLFGGVFVG